MSGVGKESGIDPDHDPDAQPVAYPGIRGLSRVSRRELAFLIGAVPEGGRVLEVGSASGATAARVADERPGAWVVSVDSMEGRDRPDVVAEDGDRLGNWLANRRPNMALWLGTLDGFAATGPAARFDLAFVDVDHPYANVKRALEVAAGLLAPGGKVIVHDFGHPEWPDVEPATRDFAIEAGFAIEGECGRMRRMGKAMVEAEETEAMADAEPAGEPIRYPCGCVNERVGVGPAPIGYLRAVEKCAGHRARMRDPRGLEAAYYAELGVLEGERLRATAHVAEMARAIGAFARPRPGGSRRALEVGCGASPYGGALAEAGWSYAGLDASGWAANWSARRWGGRAIVADLETWEPGAGERYGLVLSAHTLEHVGEPVAALGKMARALGPGGVLYLLTPDDSDPVNPDHRVFFAAGSLRAAVEAAGLRVEAVEARRVVAHEVFLYVRARKPEGA